MGTAAETIAEVSNEPLDYIGYPDAFYELYDDDGVTPIAWSE